MQVYSAFFVLGSGGGVKALKVLYQRKSALVKRSSFALLREPYLNYSTIDFPLIFLCNLFFS